MKDEKSNSIPDDGERWVIADSSDVLRNYAQPGRIEPRTHPVPPVKVSVRKRLDGSRTARAGRALP